jgi:hypothetical protein
VLWHPPAVVTDFDSLIQQNKSLEDRASQVQHDDGTHESSQFIHELVTDYNEWFARALDGLPDEFEERFRHEFKGQFWDTKIKDFLDSPTKPNAFFDPDAESAYRSLAGVVRECKRKLLPPNGRSSPKLDRRLKDPANRVSTWFSSKDSAAVFRNS